MLKRKIEDKISEWLENPRTALMITGARQVGKTWTIKHVLESRHKYYVEFNLLDQPGVADCFLKRTSVDDLLSKLSLFAETEMKPGCVIFIDEAQVCTDIVTQIKFLVDDGRYSYILSGSLLGVELNDLRSAPVGYLRVLAMYPMDFEEFLQIYKVPQSIIESLQKCFDLRQPVDNAVHDRLVQYFNMYMLIGGMPAAVQTYADSKSIPKVMEVHSEISEVYKMDFTRYESSNKEKKLVLNRIYDIIPDELEKKNKRFVVSDLNKSRGEDDKYLRLDRNQNSFLWLTQAGVAIPVFNASQPMATLKANSKQTLFKLFLADVGMLTSAYGRITKQKIISMEKDIRKGAMFENVVSQELLAHGFDKQFYYISKKLGELDFVIEYNDEILPIEVKSGKDYDEHTALDNVMNMPDYGIKEAFVFSYKNVSTSKDGRTVYLPLYMIMFVKKETEFQIEDPGAWPVQ